MFYVWIKLKSFGEAFPVQECSLAFTLSPWILVYNCQAVLLILHLWVRGQLWASGHWAPVSSHQARHTFEEMLVFIMLLFFAQSLFHPLSLSQGKQEMKVKHRMGGQWYSFESCLYCFCSNMAPVYFLRHFFLHFPLKSFILYFSILYSVSM